MWRMAGILAAPIVLIVTVALEGMWLTRRRRGQPSDAGRLWRAMVLSGLALASALCCVIVSVFVVYGEQGKSATALPVALICLAIAAALPSVPLFAVDRRVVGVLPTVVRLLAYYWFSMGVGEFYSRILM